MTGNDYTLLYDTIGGSYVPSVTEKFGTEVTLSVETMSLQERVIPSMGIWMKS